MSKSKSRATKRRTATRCATPARRSGDELHIDPRNANLGTERGRALLETSLRQYGAGRAVLADRDGVLIAGNKTFEVAQRLGIPTRVVETDGGELVVGTVLPLFTVGDVYASLCKRGTYAPFSARPRSQALF